MRQGLFEETTRMHSDISPRKIDLERFPRRAHFDYFRSLAYPYVGVTVDVDISCLMEARRESGAPFFLTLLYHVSRAANTIPELRQRIWGDDILEYAWCPTSHTVAKPDGTYAYCNLWANTSFDAFLTDAIQRQEACKRNGSIEESAEASLSCLFVTSLPWLQYTALVQPAPNPADSNPRISWGKRFARGKRTMIPMSLLCHHALVDGLHLSRFYDALQAEMESI